MTTETMQPEIQPAEEDATTVVPYEGTNLYAGLCERRILEEACRFVLDHPGEISMQSASLDEMRECREKFLDKLEWELRSRTYRPGPVFRFCRVRRRGHNECLRVLLPRDRVVCGALLLTVEPVLEAADPSARAASRVLAVVQAALRNGCYRVVPQGENDVLCRDALWDLLRRVNERVHDEAVRELIKLLLRARVVEELRLAS